MTDRTMFLAPAALALSLQCPAAGQPVTVPSLLHVETAPAAPADLLPHQERIAHAQASLIALREGRLSVSDLSPLELQDVLDLDRMLRGNAIDTRMPAQQCVDREVKQAGGNPSTLAWSEIRLKCR